PWLTRSAMLSREEHRSRTLRELNEIMVTRLEEFVEDQARQLDPDLPAVLLGHCHLFGAEIGAERWLVVGEDPMVSVGALRHPNVDYVALGHIHRKQLVPGDPPIAYSGSINRVDFSEEDEAKGFWIADVHPGRAEPTFVEVKARRFETGE